MSYGGIQSLRGIARAFAARGIPTARGGVWSPVQVRAILQRTAGLIRHRANRRAVVIAEGEFDRLNVLDALMTKSAMKPKAKE